jgi:nicotinamide mononucleotide transporter
MFGAPTTWGEIAGFTSGAWCVWLVARIHLWNWPVGIANNLFFLLLFFSAGLYADGALQVVYIVLAVYGWWAWLHGGTGREHLPVTRTTPAQWSALCVVGVVGTFALAGALTHWTNSEVPGADAITTMLSLLATWGQTRKKVESWWLWIAADVIYIPLYQYKQLTLTALLYLGFLTLCVRGLANWTRELRAIARSGSPDAAKLASRGER